MQTYDNVGYLDDIAEIGGKNADGATDSDDEYVIIESDSENCNYPSDRKMNSAPSRERGADTRLSPNSGKASRAAGSSRRPEQTTAHKESSRHLHRGKGDIDNKGNSTDVHSQDVKREKRNNYSPSKQSEQLKQRSSPASHPNTLRNVVYYQNRFIVLESNDGDTTRSPSNVSSKRTTLGTPSKTMAEGQSSSFLRDGESETALYPGSRSRMRNMEIDASSVTMGMDARGIDIIVTDPDNSSRNITDSMGKKDTLLKRIQRLLIDNRMKGKPPIEQSPDEYRVLKKVLNISFLTIGIVLFVAVVVVVIYAFIGESLSNTK